MCLNLHLKLLKFILFKIKLKINPTRYIMIQLGKLYVYINVIFNLNFIRKLNKYIKIASLYARLIRLV